VIGRGDAVQNPEVDSTPGTDIAPDRRQGRDTGSAPDGVAVPGIDVGADVGINPDARWGSGPQGRTRTEIDTGLSPELGSVTAPSLQTPEQYQPELRRRRTVQDAVSSEGFGQDGQTRPRRPRREQFGGRDNEDDPLELNQDEQRFENPVATPLGFIL